MKRTCLLRRMIYQKVEVSTESEGVRKTAAVAACELAIKQDSSIKIRTQDASSSSLSSLVV